jgi:phosphatidylinositol alpha-mannosyltransferase
MSFVLSRLDARIAVSEPARDFVRAYFDGNYQIVPNGIDTNRFGETVDPFVWARDGAPRVLFVGRFDERRKGFAYLLRAWPQVRRAIPRARLLVVGSGRPERFTRLVERAGAESIDFVGLVSAEDLPRYYASCDVFCAPSVERESFGIILLEAMASRKPVVASAIPGYAGVLTDEREGLLVPPRSPTALAAALVRTLGDRSLAERLGRAGRTTALTYAWPRIAATVLEVYERAKAEAATAPWRDRLAKA